MQKTGLDLGLASEGSSAQPGPALFCPLAIGEWYGLGGQGPKALVITEQLVGCSHNFDHCHRQVPARIWIRGWTGSASPPTPWIVQPHRARAKTLPEQGASAPCPNARGDRAGQPCLQRWAGACWKRTMRAHPKSTRMASIRVLAFKLVRRIARSLPNLRRPRAGRSTCCWGCPV